LLEDDLPCTQVEPFLSSLVGRSVPEGLLANNGHCRSPKSQKEFVPGKDVHEQRVELRAGKGRAQEQWRNFVQRQEMRQKNQEKRKVELRYVRLSSFTVYRGHS